MSRNARFSYLFLAFYVSITELMWPTFVNYYNPNDQTLLSTESIRAILYCGWLIKPVYGFLGDCVYPFYFRVKGFVVILATLAIIASVYLVTIVKYGDENKNPHWMLAIETFIFSCIAFIDSICRRPTV